LYYAVIGIYNVYFHPLSNYPGPLLAAASSLWYHRALAQGTIAQDFLALHEKYGEIVRITPDELSYVNPENWREIYGKKPGKDKQELVKDQRYHDTVKPATTLLTADWDEHSYYRKILSNTFSDRTLKEQEYVLHDFANLLIKKLHEECEEGKKPLNMVDWWNVHWLPLSINEPFLIVQREVN
jgi:cytochrome P450